MARSIVPVVNGGPAFYRCGTRAHIAHRSSRRIGTRRY